MSTVKPILQSAAHTDWSQFEGVAALRCTAGVAIPLFVGLLLREPSVGAFGAIGAVSVGFGSFQGAYRSRAAVMNYAAVAMALALFAGSLAGRSDTAAILAAIVVAFASGLLVAVGPAAAFVALQAAIAVLIAGGFPADARGAAGRAALVLLGGLVQTLLVVIIWPLRRFSAERQTIAAAYRSLADFAARMFEPGGGAPEPHTFAATASPLADPQPFARASDLLVFQALLDEAERIRASLAALAARERQLNAADPSCARRFAESADRVAREIADAVAHGRDPRETTPLWYPLEQCARQLPYPAAVAALLGQLRAAWRTAGVMTTEDGPPAAPARLTPLRRRPPVADALTTLSANLTPASTAFRHAVRLAATVGAATAVYRLLDLPRGYWIPMTALLVLRPEFHDTFARGIARVAGTIGGAGLATIIVHLMIPGHGALTLLVLAFVWGCYALFRTNYAMFTVCLTGYVVFILMLGGVGELTAASTRALYTIEGGALALAVYAVWPTWAASTARAALAAMLDAHGAYVAALLQGFADPGSVDLDRLADIRAGARLARSNAEAVIERMVAEPESRAAISPRVAIGILAALRRHALAALALHAGLERGVAQPVAGMQQLTGEMTSALAQLAAAIRAGTAPDSIPDLRATQSQLGATPALVEEETDLMVDSINTIASLLGATRPTAAP
ncbi:MAG TPA: FUSC family protein [Vicinamibacterales bacterium]|nr:FUSC family protein [Vicinamibacterales bacterium]